MCPSGFWWWWTFGIKQKQHHKAVNFPSFNSPSARWKESEGDPYSNRRLTSAWRTEKPQFCLHFTQNSVTSTRKLFRLRQECPTMTTFLLFKTERSCRVLNLCTCNIFVLFTLSFISFPLVFPAFPTNSCGIFRGRKYNSVCNSPAGAD